MQKVNVLGIGIDPVDRVSMFDAVERFIEQGKSTVAYVNVHVLNIAAHDQRLRDFLNAADLCYCDGNGVRLGARLLGKQLPEKLTAADFMWELAARAEGRWRLFWIGGVPGVSAIAATRLRERYPRLQIETEHGFLTEFSAFIAKVNAARPHIVFVGMGTPIQEHWVNAWRGQINAPLVWVVGAAADFIGGRLSRGPEWLYSRQEWLARLITEPRRLWRRYIFGNLIFLGRILLCRAFKTGNGKLSEWSSSHRKAPDSSRS